MHWFLQITCGWMSFHEFIYDWPQGLTDLSLLYCCQCTVSWWSSQVAPTQENSWDWSCPRQANHLRARSIFQARKGSQVHACSQCSATPRLSVQHHTLKKWDVITRCTDYKVALPSLSSVFKQLVWMNTAFLWCPNFRVVGHHWGCFAYKVVIGK